MSASLDKKLDRTLAWVAGRKDVHDVVVHIHRPRDGFSWIGSSGGVTETSEYFIASTTKLFTTALILQLEGEGKFSLDSTIAKLLPDLPWDELHVVKGVDYTGEVSVRHLLSQTSGIADYFQGKMPNGASLEQQILRGEDTSWDASQAMKWAKEIGAAFPPGAKAKALYSDTGYQLLGALVESVCGMPFQEALRQRIIEPLGLKHTAMFHPEANPDVLPLRVGPNQVHVPLAMQSFGPDGGVISTALEMMTFLRAFFEGSLFPSAKLPELYEFKRLFFPLEYGVGLMRFRMPWIFSPFRPMPPLLGHSGLSGAFAFFAPERGVYLTGTVNQIRDPGTSFQMMMRFLSSL